jgi:hypothetical protein
MTTEPAVAPDYDRPTVQSQPAGMYPYNRYGDNSITRYWDGADWSGAPITATTPELVATAGKADQSVVKRGWARLAKASWGKES